MEESQAPAKSANQPESPTPETSNLKQTTSQNILTPVAILLGFGMIAAAIYFSGGVSPAANPEQVQDQAAEPAAEGSPSDITPVTAEDWIRGNPNAPIKIVEYSDFNCSWCGRFHETMKQIISEYGPSGEVAWIYRHFPLQPNSSLPALASECVGRIGDTEAFWSFTDAVFEAQEGATNLATLATAAGIDETEFNDCMSEERYMDDVRADFENGRATGGTGTPHNIVIVGDQTFEIRGAQPYSSVKQIVDELLAQIEQSQ